MNIALLRDPKVLKNVATRVAGRSLLVTRKHAPAILTTVGILGGITSTVLASKATLRLEPILEVHDMNVIDAKELRVMTDDDGRPMLTEKAYTREVALAYARTGLSIIKLYGPALSVGIVSITCVISSHNIMQKREASLIAAYAAVERSFAEYRKRVEASIGSEKEAALRYAVSEKKEKDPVTGKDVVTTVVDPNGISVYARFFDELNRHWSKDPEYNLIFLKAHQQFANDLLLSRGHVFLNEIYDDLGMERTSAGAVVGWILTKDGTGDNFVDFGIYNGGREAVREFVNGQETSILLDFNVNGTIFDKI